MYKSIEQNGFSIYKGISKDDFNNLYGFVLKRFLNTARTFNFMNPDLRLESYNDRLLPVNISHSNLWGKRERCILCSDVTKLQSLAFIRKLASEFGPFKITDEENLGFGNVYYRLVRRGCNDDVGPVHRDSWFWTLSGRNTGRRLKVWIPLLTNGEAAFKFIPGSHNSSDYQWEVIERYGVTKPSLATAVSESKFSYFGSNTGEAIIFHDELIHGGMPCLKGNRVSLEFTMELLGV